MRALLVLVAACSAPAPSTTITKPQPVSPVPDAAAPAVPFADDVIVIEAKGLVTRTNMPWRPLRRLVAARRGRIQLDSTDSQIMLNVSKVVSGKLFDPDLAKRPPGTNRLEVVLVDEAAYVASIMTNRDSYEGTWRLTELADGTLVASSIEDTPWQPSLVAGRGMMLANARADLRSPAVDRRLAGLDMLRSYKFYELVPDVIALLDDKRTQGSREVGGFAHLMLRALAASIGDHDAPNDAAIHAWTVYWNDRFTQVPPLPAVAPGTLTEHLRVTAPESWPEVNAASNGIVVGVRMLEPALDGNTYGIFVTRDGARTWLARDEFHDITVAGTGVIWSDAKSQWHFTTTTGKSAPLPREHATATGATITTAGDGFLVLSFNDSRHLLAAQLEANGKQRRGRPMLLPSVPDPYSNAGGMRVIDAAPRPGGGWLAVVSTRGGLVTVAIEDGFTWTTNTISPKNNIQPRIAVGRDRALVAWIAGLEIEVALIDGTGKLVSQGPKLGIGVTFVAKPVALDDGFALAWIEDFRDIRLARFDREGKLVSNVVVQAGHIGPFNVDLARDQKALLVTYVDQTRYPYAIVTKRL